MSMTSNKAYLVRAFYDWIVDNDCTPYIVADAFYPGVAVPQQHVSDGQPDYFLYYAIWGGAEYDRVTCAVYIGHLCS